MAMNTCASCKFFEQDNANQGACRRNPPTPFPTGSVKGNLQITSAWPSVQSHNWCGEWVIRLEIARHAPPPRMQQ